MNTVIFDMDGLLIDSEPLWQEAANEIFSINNVSISKDEYDKTTGLRTAEFLEHWFNHFKLDKSLLIRNSFAHFNMLRNGKNFNITTYINQARQLMSYDRKLKNAVAKSVIDIFKKEGIDIKFSCDEKHELNNPKVESQTIYHLGGQKDIPEKKHLCEYIEMVKTILYNL